MDKQDYWQEQVNLKEILNNAKQIDEKRKADRYIANIQNRITNTFLNYEDWHFGRDTVNNIVENYLNNKTTLTETIKILSTTKGEKKELNIGLRTTNKLMRILEEAKRPTMFTYVKNYFAPYTNIG